MLATQKTWDGINSTSFRFLQSTTQASLKKASTVWFHSITGSPYNARFQAPKKSPIELAQHYVPILKWLSKYEISQDLKFDGVAGITVASRKKSRSPPPCTFLPTTDLHCCHFSYLFSRPVMGEFISAGGLLIMLSQFQNVLGVKFDSQDYPVQTLYQNLEKHWPCQQECTSSWLGFDRLPSSRLLYSLTCSMTHQPQTLPQVTS